MLCLHLISQTPWGSTQPHATWSDKSPILRSWIIVIVFVIVPVVTCSRELQFHVAGELLSAGRIFMIVARIYMWYMRYDDVTDAPFWTSFPSLSIWLIVFRRHKWWHSVISPSVTFRAFSKLRSMHFVKVTALTHNLNYYPTLLSCYSEYCRCFIMFPVVIHVLLRVTL